MKKGVVYIATGETCYNEALRSANSVKKHNPDLEITIFSERDAVDTIFDQFIKIEDPLFSTFDKVKHLWRTPYGRTLYLDSDTFVTDSFDDLFDILDYCDFAGTLSAGFHHDNNYADVPKGLWEINGGVLLFCNSEAVISTLQSWYDEYEIIKPRLTQRDYPDFWLNRDQPSLRNLIWKNRDIRVGILPFEYNTLRQFGTRVWGKAIIVHGPGAIDRIAQEMNRTYGCNRVYLQGAGVIQPFQNLNLVQSLKQVFYILRAIAYFQGQRLLRR